VDEVLIAALRRSAMVITIASVRLGVGVRAGDFDARGGLS
jgi:hypothetical protein